MSFVFLVIWKRRSYDGSGRTNTNTKTK